MRSRATATEPRRRVTVALLVLLVAVVLAAPASASAAAPIWRLEQPPPPAGAPFKVALGAPGDLKFWSPSRGLLAVEGNAVIPAGLFTWNGASWRQLSVVCGGSASTTRIAWAGPAEFWVISSPSRPRVGNGITLCHFKDGQVVASYGTPPNSADPYQVMNAAACDGPSDCWFAGAAATDPTGARSGAFRLHWDGQALTTSYGPQGRGVSDLEAFGGTFWQSSYAGPGNENRAGAENRTPESTPLLLSRLGPGGAFSTDPWAPAALVGVPADGADLLGLDGSGTDLWAVGGGAASGTAAPAEAIVARPPLVVHRGAGAARWTQVPLTAPEGTFGGQDRFAAVAAVPGGTTAWAALQAYAERASANARARVALIDSATGTVSVTRLPVSGAGRGVATRLACPAADQCWMATRAGWLFHWSDGTALPVDENAAFAALITFRPNESAAQFVPDKPPVDDSLLLAPPPVEVVAPAAPAKTNVKKVAPILRDIRRPVLRGTTLILRFRLTRRAKVALVGRRGGRVVARTPLRLHAKGRVTLRLRLRRSAWPTKLAFVVRIPGSQPTSGGDDTNIVTTGGGTDTTTTATTSRLR